MTVQTKTQKAQANQWFDHSLRLRNQLNKYKMTLINKNPIRKDIDYAEQETDKEAKPVQKKLPLSQKFDNPVTIRENAIKALEDENEYIKGIIEYHEILITRNSQIIQHYQTLNTKQDEEKKIQSI